jgi:hypothetical protein
MMMMMPGVDDPFFPRDRLQHRDTKNTGEKDAK